MALPRIPRIIDEDPHYLVLHKPAGLLSQGEVTGDANLVDWLRGYLGRPYVGLVHRLDRNTSGLMVVAKRTKAAQRLTDQLRTGKLTRSYQAWLVGTLTAPARWEHWLLKDAVKNETRVVNGPRSGAPGGVKNAVLRVQPLRPGNWRGIALTLAEFELETGRSHQIRVQAAASGFPLLGDPKYGARSGPGADFGRPALHSCRLSFEHPISKEPRGYNDELPEDMRI